MIMGYIYLLTVALIFSFGGVCSKTIAPYFGAHFISFFRFFVGVGFILLVKLLKRQRFRDDFPQMFRKYWGWLVFGAAAKWLSYLAENYGFAHGLSFGNIIEPPVAAVVSAVISVVLFKDKLTPKKIFCIFLCVAGAFCISWNGRPLEEFLSASILTTMMFVLAGALGNMLVLAQKMLLDKMDIIDSNLTTFAIAAVFAVIPVIPDVASGAVSGVQPSLACYAAILFFGFTTGIGFILNAKALPLVPFYMVPIIQSTMILFSITWGILFFHETVTWYIIIGSLIFIVGLVWLNILNSKPEKA